MKAIMITLTEQAAQQIKSMQADPANADKVLHLKVEAGGCSGMEYAMTFSELQEGTPVFERSGAKLAVDAKSLKVISGSEINFDDGLHGKGFDIRNPNANSTCGCGRSFS
jgi:iron-sulfur cluster assembly protein